MNLKPCPFCGRPATVLCIFDGDCMWFQTSCEPDDGKCKVSPMSNRFVTRSEAIAAWNRRKADR